MSNSNSNLNFSRPERKVCFIEFKQADLTKSSAPAHTAVTPQLNRSIKLV